MSVKYCINGKQIINERLVLRSFATDDLEDFYEYAKVPGVGEMAGWKHHENIDETKRILNMFIDGDHTYAITLKDSGKVIGSLGVEVFSLEDRFSEFNGLNGKEIGFVLSKDYWNNGYMTEACKAIIDHLFNEINFDYLICCHSDINAKSKRVQEKCGFKPYRKVIRTSALGDEAGVINLQLNPNKNIKLIFSHPESLIWKK